jgi:hypothetical protein
MVGSITNGLSFIILRTAGAGTRFDHLFRFRHNEIRRWSSPLTALPGKMTPTEDIPGRCRHVLPPGVPYSIEG